MFYHTVKARSSTMVVGGRSCRSTVSRRGSNHRRGSVAPVSDAVYPARRQGVGDSST